MDIHAEATSEKRTLSGILASQFSDHGIDPRTAPLYAQMLVGIVSSPAWWWLENRAMSKEEAAAHMVNLAWNGLRAMEPKPELRDGYADKYYIKAFSIGLNMDILIRSIDVSCCLR